MTHDMHSFPPLYYSPFYAVTLVDGHVAGRSRILREKIVVASCLLVLASDFQSAHTRIMHAYTHSLV